MERQLKRIRILAIPGLLWIALACSFLSSGAGGEAQPWKTEVKGTPAGGSETGAAPTEKEPVEFRSLKDMGRIVFSSIRENGLSDIYMMNADGSDVHFLNMADSIERAPAWSPDGEWIAFLGNGNRNTFDIMRMRPGGADLSNLTDTTSDESGFDWSPDGSQIAFTSNRSGNYELYVMDADGSNVKQLTQTVDVDEAEPAFSPNGATIGCLCGPAGEYTGDICLVNADGSGETNLTPDDPDIDDFIWSPDGSRIAFGMPLAPEEIWMMGADGEGKENLTNDPADDGGIAFSPDGSTIVFSSDRDGKTKQIYLVHLDDRSITPLTDNDMVNVSPAFSPDGAWVVFVQAKSLGEFDFELFAVRIDGKGLTNLTSNPGKDSGADWEPI
jgi:Tol biopolymer transport system component